MAGNVEIVRLLLQAGAMVDFKGQCDRHALHLAAMWGRLEIVHALLDAGADIESKADNGE